MNISDKNYYSVAQVLFIIKPINGFGFFVRLNRTTLHADTNKGYLITLRNGIQSAT